MPNWMKVNIEVSNETDFDFTRDFKSFNDIVPMPKLLRRTTSGYVSRFVQAHHSKGLAWLLEHSKHGRALEIARNYRAITTLGYESWYNWSVKHWGVKWDMDITDVEPGKIEFDVPWCFPEPLIEALVAKFPEVQFVGEFAEEQPGWFSGTFDTENGIFSIDYDIEFTNEAYERYFSFWGGKEDYQLIDGEYVYIEE